MSHHPETNAPCPNCGFAATNNYCAQCGQETHLHKETFWGLVMHFVGHYFHYDSKFWKTMKALWFAPGKLTREYWEGKRARHIPPVSLYIFISAVYFIAYFSVQKNTPAGIRKQLKNSVSALRHVADSLDKAEGGADTIQVAGGAVRFAPSGDSIGVNGFMNRKIAKFNAAGEEGKRHLTETFNHNIPKIYFFMIPVVALLLKMLFARRKGTYFVHHAIFSLHAHSFFFSLFLLQVLNPFLRIDIVLRVLFMVVFAVYFVRSMRRAYAISYGRAILNTVIVGIGYLIFFILAFLVTYFIILISF